MKRLVLAVVLVLGAVSASAQSVYLSQDFSDPAWASNHWNSDGVSSQFYSNGGYGGLGGSPGGSAVNTLAPSSSGTGDITVTVRMASAYVSGTAYAIIGATIDTDRVTGTGYYYYAQYQNEGDGTAILSVNAVTPSCFCTLASLWAPTPHDGLTLHLRLTPNGQLSVFIDGNVVYSSSVQTMPTGGTLMGVGVGSGDPSFLISHADLSTPDTTPPNAIPASSITMLADSYSYITLQWPSTTDNPGGSGVYQYQLFRNGQLISTQNSGASSYSYTDTNLLPNQTYSYMVTVFDAYLNSVSTTVSFTTLRVPTNPPYPSTIPDGRRIGVRPTGAYWGGGSENIDVMSGNLNFVIPLLKPQARTGWSAPFSLSYNSQNWRQQGGSTSHFGEDIGYGYGWKLMAGSMTPVWVGTIIDHWIFTDASGAQYNFTANNNNVWTSPESLYASFDANANTLYFRDGKFWVFGCVSAAAEADAGVMYPTLMEDTNGNQIVISYNNGAGGTWANSSARIATIQDVRGRDVNAYQFTYNTDSTPHLTSITNHIANGEAYAFSYAGGQPLSSPINGASFGTTTFLSAAAVSGLNITHTFSYNGAGEMTQVILPYGGYFTWDYDTVTYSSGISYREVQRRHLSKDGTAASETIYPFSHEGSITAPIHQYTVIDDPGGVGEKYWAFVTSGAAMSLVTQYQGRQLPGPVVKTQNDFTWTQDSVGNNYISTTLSTLDVGQTYQAQSKTTQTVDNNGNVTQVNNFNYGNLTAPVRTYNYTYVNGSAYASRYILNRLSTATVTSGGNTTTLVTNSYDSGFQTISGTIPLWDTNYASVTARGNLTMSITPSGTSTTTYDQTGNIYNAGNNGVVVNASTTGTTNFAVPSQLTIGGMTTNLSWSSFLGLTNETGPNGDSSSTYFDSYARKQSTTSPFGATTNYTYNSAPYTSSNPATVTATTNNRWTRTTLDGLGRTLKVETGDANGTKSAAETMYDSCGCSPLGKMTKQAMPHLPSAAAVYTIYGYDGIGRTVSVVAPDGASTTQYLYQGNTVKTTDPAGKWKIFTMDAFGHLIQVEEPNPAGGADFFTYYTYDVLDNLTQVSMPRPSGTQTRTFTYSGKNLMSVTNPENGTVTYTYNGYNKVATKTDAKGQQIVYSYDSLARLTKVQRYTTGSPYNLALNKPATESSAVYAPASLAVDGNTDGNYFDNSVSHTGLDANAWWEVDLGVSATVSSVVIWNRTDCCSDRLSDYWVFVSNTPFSASDTPATLAGKGGTYSSHQTSAPSPNTVINFSGVPGRYVRVQLSGTNYLALAEVQVMGTTSGTPVEDTCQQENYAYDTNPFNSGYSQNSLGRLTAVQYYGGISTPGGPACPTTFIEQYSYNQGGAKTNKGLLVMRKIYWQSQLDGNGNPSGPINTTYATADLESSYSYDNEGRMTGIQYPGSNDGNGNATAGPGFGYGYDSMGRLSTMTNPDSSPVIASATYGPSNELLTMSGQINETRTYNSMLQLVGLSNGGVNITYSYSATQNNGKITSQLTM